MFDRHGRRSQHVFLNIRPDDPCQRRLIHLDLNCEVDLLYLSVDATATVIRLLSSIYVELTWELQYDTFHSVPRYAARPSDSRRSLRMP